MSKNEKRTGTCPGCIKERELTPFDNLELCSECGSIAEMIARDKDRVTRIKNLLPERKNGDPVVLPEVLDAVRYRTKDREHNSWYVSISEMKGEPVEIFASTAFDRDQHLQSRISNLTTITRLVSLVLRHIALGEDLTLEKTLTQLHRSSRQRDDLPDMLVKVLSKYANRPEDIARHEVETP
ncbi:MULTISPECIES: hypothetical protein [Desulfosediminicola]|uniref:TSCPD domain-containing protein n=1 Tax=Desulfosediminicola TaxID=2886823 RepID=UPI001E41385B|nr:hypothetical protein [Desulfosediminicola ganghwensis]